MKHVERMSDIVTSIGLGKSVREISKDMEIPRSSLKEMQTLRIKKQWENPEIRARMESLWADPRMVGRKRFLGMVINIPV